MGRETILRFKEFDYAISGEGENSLVELLTALDKGADLDHVSSLIYRKYSLIHNTPQRPINRNLDELPMPAWDLLADFPQAYKPAVYDFPCGPVATIAASRGCPFHCKFCDTSTFGDRVRYYSPVKVFEMMQHLHTIYGVRHIMFVDDLFLASKTRVTDLCKMIIDSGIKVTWSCTARVDTVKPEVLALMKEAGCWEISFGLETGSNGLLKKMGKAANIEKSERAINWTFEAGIRSKGLFMLGFPGEDENSIAETKKFIRRIPMTIMNLSKFTPYPGSPVYHDLYGTNIRKDHWEKMNGMNFVWSPEGLSVEELDKQYKEILMAFYRRPEIGFHYARLTILYPNHFLRLLCFGLAYLKSRIGVFLSRRKRTQVKSYETTLD